MLPPDCAPSSIPEDAEEVLIETHGPGRLKADLVFVCRRDGKDVGVRQRLANGRLIREHGLRDGKHHGWDREWDDDGRLAFESFRVNNVEHGVCRQWYEGRLVGWYLMDHGTGVDLWRDADGMLQEERHLKHQGRHGYERWWTNNTTIWWEQHFHENREHGIERKWLKEHGRVSRGYPRYYVHGERVSKRQYLSAAKRDPTLPPYRPEDDRPERPLPPEYFATQPPAVPPTMPANPEEWRS